MNQSSFSSQLPVVSEPEQPRSWLFHMVMVLGSCSALLWVAPAFIRSLRALVVRPPHGSVGSSLLEVSLTGLALVCVAGLVWRSVGEARVGFRRLNKKRSWEDVLAEEELRDAERYGSFERRLSQSPAASLPAASVPAFSVEANEPRQVRAQPILRLVGSEGRSLRNASGTPPRQQSASTQLGFGQVSPAPAVIRGEARWVDEPQYFTPYPFSVWSFHDNLPDPVLEDLSATRQPWVWLMLALVCVSLLTVFLAIRPLL